MRLLKNVSENLDHADMNKEGRVEISQEALDRFDKLMEENPEVPKDKEYSFLGDLFGKKQDVSDDYGETGEKCISILQEMADVFSQENWEKLNGPAREEALDTLGKKIGIECGVDIKGVETVFMPLNVAGRYNGDGYLYVNAFYVGRDEKREDILQTVFHEFRHAFQYAAIENPDVYGVDEKTAEIWKRNMDNYLSPEKFGYKRYHEQPVEVDANKFADYVVKNGGV